MDTYVDHEEKMIKITRNKESKGRFVKKDFLLRRTPKMISRLK